MPLVPEPFGLEAWIIKRTARPVLMSNFFLSRMGTERIELNHFITEALKNIKKLKPLGGDTLFSITSLPIRLNKDDQFMHMVQFLNTLTHFKKY